MVTQFDNSVVEDAGLLKMDFLGLKNLTIIKDCVKIIKHLHQKIIDIDKVIKLIRASEDATVAKACIIKTFKLSDEQATYILDMPLRRLTKMSKIELENEAKELKATISSLTAILKTEESIKAKVSEELSEVEKKYASPRRTRLVA